MRNRKPEPQPRRVWPLVMVVLFFGIFGDGLSQLVIVFLGIPGLAMVSDDD